MHEKLRSANWARALVPSLAAWLASAAVFSVPAASAQEVQLQLRGANDTLRDAIRGASLLYSGKDDEDAADAQDLLASARADYGRILGALYAQGHYSGVIRILIDGREAAAIPPLDAPDVIRTIVIEVDPGPGFRFSRAEAAPLARGTELPEGFAMGQPARSGEIVGAADAGAEAWRNAGHAKVRVGNQQVTANHTNATLDARIGFDPGPRVTFGQMAITGNERVRARRIDKIAGFPTGEVYDPEELEDVAERLRRTGAFRSVALTEAESLGPGATLDYQLVVVEEKRRRMSFGAEVSSLDGALVSAGWMHRNLLGGAEKLTINGEIGGIGSQTGAEDYSLGVRLDRPGTPFRDSTAFVEALVERAQEEDYTADTARIGFGLTRYITDQLTGEVSIGYEISEVTDEFDEITYEQLVLPVKLTWDTRDNALDAVEGYYAQGEVTAFRGFGTTGTGARLAFDGRAYHGFGAEDRVVLAGRVQGGAIVGSDLLETPREYLFYSGGGGTVRGQPYQSLGVEIDRGGGQIQDIGGDRFVAFSAEVRAGIRGNFGAVAFYDAGFVGVEDFSEDNGAWQSGAGVGLRYDTGIGPIRLDVAAPVSGDTGDGVQIYLGIGQAF
ncbi:autotransporter assembly complex family protein [Frigidibacter sp.]|uniref:autotransporter assembly complex protein TamA n=1 Tax=Frigidibacter sp. TaxID=2586418 RepID=UPI0027358B43|nr:autotransporter assembly complex family protein [Frigidibacter sp.]MDP3339154.1 autotransporter assembly complex family protein [Frigidibacter sp.]